MRRERYPDVREIWGVTWTTQGQVWVGPAITDPRTPGWPCRCATRSPADSDKARGASSCASCGQQPSLKASVACSTRREGDQRLGSTNLRSLVARDY